MDYKLRCVFELPVENSALPSSGKFNLYLKKYYCDLYFFYCILAALISNESSSDAVYSGDEKALKSSPYSKVSFFLFLWLHSFLKTMDLEPVILSLCLQRCQTLNL